MKGGARRMTTSSDLPPPQPQPVQNEINDEENHQVQYDEQNRQQEHQQQRSMNDVGDDENEYEEEEDIGYDRQSADENVQEEDADEQTNGDEERPKLAEGFYEIEAVRKKRVRKGETQYLIKWSGWPEADNTWEPVENLMSCPDVIHAFEESMRSGKQRSNRGRKRKNSVAPTLQSKKQKQHSPTAATYKIPSVQLNIIERPSSVPLADNPISTVGREKNERIYAHSNDAARVRDVEPNEPRVSDSSILENLTDFAIHIQEERAAEGVSPTTEVRPTTGMLKVGSCVGARRRKSCAVKRFKQELNSHPTHDADDATVKTTNADDIVVINDASPAGNSFDPNNILDASRNTPVIANIIKPVNYSTSILNGTENVCVSFLVRSSDGEEVIVDNKYLKEHNPLLLINFYEQHLRYNNPPE